MRWSLLIAPLAALLLLSCNVRDDSIRLGLIRPSLNHLPVQYGLELGIIDSVDVSLHYFNSGWEVNEALVAGKLDAAIIPFTYAWTDIARGHAVRIASFLERESDGIVTSVRYPELASLEGRRVGVLRASTLDVFARMLSERERLDWELIPFRSPVEMAAALQSGQVDALSYYVPPIFKPGRDFHTVAWYSDFFPGHPCCDLVIHESALSSKRESLLWLYGGLQKTVGVMTASPEDVLACATRHFDMADSLLRKSVMHTQYRFGLEKSGRDFERMTAQTMHKQGYLDKEIDPEAVYVDLSAE